MNRVGMQRVAVCVCGQPVVGSHEQPRQSNRYWCGECVAFVEAAIRGAEAFHGYLPDGGLDMPNFLIALERRLMEAALQRAGTTAGAARLLGLNRTTLHERLKVLRRRRVEALP